MWTEQLCNNSTFSKPFFFFTHFQNDTFAEKTAFCEPVRETGYYRTHKNTEMVSWFWLAGGKKRRLQNALPINHLGRSAWSGYTSVQPGRGMGQLNHPQQWNTRNKNSNVALQSSASCKRWFEPCTKACTILSLRLESLITLLLLWIYTH